MEHARRLREKIAKTGTTASFGLACYPNEQCHFPDDLVRLADEALYLAKHQGKNRVVSAAGNLTEAKNAAGK